MSGDTSDELKNLIERFDKAPNSRLFAPLADAYRKRGEVDKAIELCEKGIEMYPDYVSARVILGKCFYDKGATERAREEFRHVLGVDPDNMVALKYMGEILLAEDKKKEAAEHYQKLLSIDPTNEEAARILKEIETQFRVKEIDLSDRKHVRDERPSELATMTLAGIYAAQGYYNKALKIYQDILQKEPENIEVKGMVDKLELLLESSEKERSTAFDEETLAVSIEEIGDGISAGPGGTKDDAVPSPEEAEEEKMLPEESSEGEHGFILVDGKADEEQREQKPEGTEKEVGRASDQKADSKAKEKRPPKKAEKDEKPPTEMENFQAWLRRLKND
jgi:tetratricopeptide (TPR) repeat protein